MSSPDITRKVEQSRVVMGILRETFFLQSVFELQTDEKSPALRAEIAEIQETDRRNECETRTLTFRILSSQSESIPISAENKVPLTCRFSVGGFTAQIIVRILATHRNGNHWLLKVESPSAIEINNRRRNRRRAIREQIPLASVLVVSNGQHAEGTLELTDFSADGWGGILHVQNGFLFGTHTMISGKLNTTTGATYISGNISRAAILSIQAGGQDSYRVGIRLKTEETDRLPKPQTDQRLTTRHSTQVQVSVKHAFHSNSHIDFIVQEASFTGFSGVTQNPLEELDYPIGTALEIEHTKLRLRFEGYDGKRYRFFIDDPDINHRLEWFKRISNVMVSGLRDRASDALDLLQIFCESGSLGAEYLKTQSSHSSEILNPFEDGTRDAFWIHRWVHHNPNQDVTGHFSAIKIGDNAWFLADLAGSPDKSRKIPKNFTELFFRSFSEFSLTLSPCPMHMYTWIHGHPYWEQFRQELARSSLIHEVALTGYTRYSESFLAREGSPEKVELTSFLPSEHGRILKLREQLTRQSLIGHADLFDFDINRFASPHLTADFHTYGHPFHREYITVDTGRTAWLAVCSSYPLGSSFNRVPDAIWVFPLTPEAPLDETEWTLVSGELFKHVLKRGIKPSSIRRLSSPDHHVALKCEAGTLESLIVHPSAGKLFKGAA